MEASDRRLAHRPGQQRTHRGSQQLDQAGQARCHRVYLLPELPDLLTPLRREARLGSAPDGQTSLMESEEPVTPERTERERHTSHTTRLGAQQVVVTLDDRHPVFNALLRVHGLHNSVFPRIIRSYHLGVARVAVTDHVAEDGSHHQIERNLAPTDLRLRGHEPEGHSTIIVSRLRPSLMCCTAHPTAGRGHPSSEADY